MDKRRVSYGTFDVVITKYLVEFNSTELRTIRTLLKRALRSRRATPSTLARYAMLDKRLWNVLGKGMR